MFDSSPNQHPASRHAFVRALIAPALAVASFLVTFSTANAQIAGLTNPADAVFARINGRVVTQAEYFRALEHLTVGTANSEATTGERMALDQLVTNTVIMAEAAKENVVPTDPEVSAYYSYQLRIFQQQMPKGADFETSQREEGRSPEDVRADLRVQMAETNLYFKRMRLTDDDARKDYDKSNGTFGLPERFLLRLVLADPDSPDFTRARDLLEKKTDFEQVARDINIPDLRATAGLLPKFTPVSNIAEPLRDLIVKAKLGDVVGPVDYKFSTDPDQPPAKAWIKVEDVRAPYPVDFADAAPMIRQRMVAERLDLPAFAPLRTDMIQKKLAASFDPTDPDYAIVWNAIRETARKAGVGQTTPTAETEASEKPVVPPAVFSALTSTLITDQSSVRAGQSVTLTYTVVNPTSAAMAISYGSGQRFDATASVNNSDDIAWRASDSQVYSTIFGKMTIEAGAKKTFTTTWRISSATPPGLYTVRAFLTPVGTPVNSTPVLATTTVTVTGG